MSGFGLRALARLWALVCLLGLAGCGGGGGGDGGSFTISMGPDPLVDSHLPSQLPVSEVVYAALSGSIPPPTLFMTLVDSGNTFNTTTVPVTFLGGNQYAFNVPIPETAAVGVHTGTLTLRVCGGAQCPGKYGSGSLSYAITIQPPTVTSVPDLSAVAGLDKVGVPLAFSATNTPADLPAYAVVGPGDATFPAQTVTLSQVTPRSGYFQGLLALQPGLSATSHSGTIGSLKFCGDAACQSLYGSYSNLPYTVQVLSVVAGQTGVSGSGDGTGTSASFNSPGNIVFDGSGNLLVADTGDGGIRRVTPAGVVTTVLGGGQNRTMNGPLAVDPAGNIYFPDNQVIERLTPQGTVSQYATVGGSGCYGLAGDGQGNLYCSYLGGANLNTLYLTQYGPGAVVKQTVSLPASSSPYPVAVDAAANVYLGGGNAVMRVLPGAPQTLTSNIQSLRSIAADSSGKLLVTTQDAGVFQITADGTQKLVVSPFMVVESGHALKPLYLAAGAGGVLYFSDTYNDLILTTTIP